MFILICNQSLVEMSIFFIKVFVCFTDVLSLFLLLFFLCLSVCSWW